MLKNSVSASSAKLFAFNTLSKALEDHWSDLPHTAAGRDEQVKFLTDFWDKLVKVRPEFGRVSIDERKKLRGSSIAGSALSIHGIIAIVADVWRTEDRDLDCVKRLAEPATAGNGTPVDYFAYKSPDWQSMGVLVSSVTASGEGPSNDPVVVPDSQGGRRRLSLEGRAPLSLPGVVGPLVRPNSSGPAHRVQSN